MPEEEHTGPLAEFVALRTEIERRATIQWHVLALQITIAGAVFGFALSGGRREVLLLVVPLTTYMTFGRYITHAVFITMISRYINTELSPRVPGGLRWEEWRVANASEAGIGVFKRLHFAGVAYPGVATLGVGAFVLSAAQNDLAAGKSWVTVVGVLVMLAIDVVLIVLITWTLWRLRHLSELRIGRAGAAPARPGVTASGWWRRRPRARRP
jgi:hypothetical protein